MISGLVSIKHGFMGPNTSVVTACSTGNHCIGAAARSIAYGEADVMIAGGAEMASTPLSIAGFISARALSMNSDPQTASRPWHKDRDGFVLSDGAGSLVLEDFDHANARGATIHAELIGFGSSSDAHHMTAPPEDGRLKIILSMFNAINDAEINLSEVDYINAHGTSTPLGDIAETIALKKVFGDSVPQISSTKSMTGHTLGAAGAIESIFCIKAINDGIIPPTINLDNPDSQCDLNYTPLVSTEKKVDVAMNNSLDLEEPTLHLSSKKSKFFIFILTLSIVAVVLFGTSESYSHSRASDKIEFYNVNKGYSFNTILNDFALNPFEKFLLKIYLKKTRLK